MKFAFPAARWLRFPVLSLLIFALEPSAHAQDTLEISKHPNFSTADNVFTFNETLYVKVISPRIDYTDLDKNAFRLEPASGGNSMEGAFTNLFDGTYTTAIVLAALERSQNNWELQVEINDRQSNGFKTRVNLAIRDNTPLPAVTLSGPIDALAPGFLTIFNKNIFVDTATKITEIGQPLKFSDLRLHWKVAVRAEKRADSLLWALTIDVLERDSEVDVETDGLLANLQDSVMIVNDINFRVVKTTALQNQNGEHINLSDFRVGMAVAAGGTPDPFGKIIATFIKIKDGNFINQEIQFTGVVQGVFVRSPLPDSIRINGDIFEVDGQTELRGFQDEPIKLTDFQLGESLEVRAQTRQSRPALALRLKRQEPSGELRAQGKIERLQDSSFIVSGVEFFRTAATIVLDDERLIIPFSALRLGLDVEVRANRQSNGRLIATLIKIEDEGNNEIELTGFIEEKTDTNVKVSGSVFLVNSATTVFDQHSVMIAFSTLRPGMIVAIRGARRFDGSVIATEIHLEDLLLENDIELRGAIAAINANSLRVTGVDFFTDANTRLLDLTGAPISFAQLSVGTIIEIRAKFGANRWLASRVMIEDEIDHEIAMVATIDSLKASVFYSLGRLIRLAEITIYRGLNNEPINFGSLHINDVVEVQGRQLPDSSLVALRVKRENRPANIREAQGKITRLGTNTLAVAAVDFAVDAATSYFDAENRSIALADLREGQIAEVKGIRQMNGTAVASRVQLQNHRVLTGIITGFFSGTVNVAGLQHISTARSVFIDEQNRPVSASEIKLQQQVRLVAKASSGEWEIVDLRILFRGSGPATEVAESPHVTLPQAFVLYQNYPNPFSIGRQFNSATVIRFALPRPEEISLTVYNQLGQKIRTISLGRLPAGLYESAWDGRDDLGARVASGVYLYRLQAGMETRIRKMIVVR